MHIHAGNSQGVRSDWAERWVADSFVAEVRKNFARYGVLDEAVRFLPGWFADALATAPISQLSVLRLDGDLYDSTMEALTRSTTSSPPEASSSWTISA
jgi:hypothetical protein